MCISAVSGAMHTSIGRGPAAYVALNATTVTCTLDICPDSEVRICGTALPVPGGAAAGERKDVEVPPSLLESCGRRPAHGVYGRVRRYDRHAPIQCDRRLPHLLQRFRMPARQPFSLRDIGGVVPGGAALGDAM